MVSTPECSDKNIFRGGKKMEGSNIFWENLGGKNRAKTFYRVAKKFGCGKKCLRVAKIFGGGSLFF